jgi:hypothetical protein
VNKLGEVCIQEMTEKVKLIWEQLKTAQARYKSYADNWRQELEF